MIAPQVRETCERMILLFATFNSVRIAIAAVRAAVYFIQRSFSLHRGRERNPSILNPEVCMHACRGGLRFVCSLRYFRGSRRMEEPNRRGDSRDCVPRASDFYIWPGPIPFRVWPNRIPRALQKEVQDRSTVWLEFARWSRFRRVTYFRASSGYTYVNAPVVSPLSVPLSLPPTTDRVQISYLRSRRIHSDCDSRAYPRVTARPTSEAKSMETPRLTDEWIICVDFRAIAREN